MINRICVIIILIIICLTAVITVSIQANKQLVIDLFVATSGNDINEGTLSSPYETINMAIQKVKELSSEEEDCIFKIHLEKGIYSFQDSIIIDSNIFGNTGNKIVFEGEEGVTFSGGRNFSIEDFTSVIEPVDFVSAEIQSELLALNLNVYGINGLPSINETSFSESSTASIEVFSNGNYLPLARYPNAGYLNGIGIGDEEYETSILTNIDNEKLELLELQTGGRLNGFLAHDWASDRIMIDNVGLDGTISSNSESSYGVRDNARYYIDNYISELDTPLEWYIDTTNSILYLYPDETLEEITISLLDTPLFSFWNSCNFSFENIIFEASRGDLVSIQESENISFINCTFRYAGNRGIKADGTSNLLIENSIFSEIGLEALDIDGGERATLTSSNNLIQNNTIAQIARQVPSIPAVRMGGVGNIFTNNLVYNIPHTALIFRGNDNIISYNEIYNACYSTADSGAIYVGRDFTYAGNRIEYNYIHDIASNSDGTLGASDPGMGTCAIYLDDQASGITVKGNIMTRVFRGILLGGGKSNEIVNNVFIDSVITITADNRGETWAAESNGTTMRNRLFNDSLDIRNSDIWLSRFPYLEELINEYDEDNYIAINAPTNNIIKNNIKCNTLINMIDNSVKRNGDVEMITEYQAYEIFENAEEDNYSFKSSFASTDFENIDFEKIGLKE